VAYVPACARKVFPVCIIYIRILPRAQKLSILKLSLGMPRKQMMEVETEFYLFLNSAFDGD
jgi:hypothetical protein